MVLIVPALTPKFPTPAPGTSPPAHDSTPPKHLSELRLDLGAGDRSKEAVGMMALHEALRSICLNSDWTYSVFWTIRPRPRVRGGSGCKVGDDHGSLMLMWEDGFCRGRAVECMDEIDNEDPVRKAFRKMSIQLYNYGEGWVLGRWLSNLIYSFPCMVFYLGMMSKKWDSPYLSRLMGKVASDKCHKWVFKEPSEGEPNASNYWQSSFDAIPPEWTDQFESGIQTIAVIQAGHGLLQLGSCKIVPEDLHFVLRMRHTFESLRYESGFYLSQLFSSTRNSSSSTSLTAMQPMPLLRPPPLFNWGQRPLAPSIASMLASPNHQSQFTPTKDETRMSLMPRPAEARTQEMMTGEHESEIQWPDGLSFFNALTGRADDGRLLFNPENLGNQPDPNFHGGSDIANPNELLSLDSQHDSMRKM